MLVSYIQSAEHVMTSPNHMLKRVEMRILFCLRINNLIKIILKFCYMKYWIYAYFIYFLFKGSLITFSDTLNSTYFNRKVRQYLSIQSIPFFVFWWRTKILFYVCSAWVCSLMFSLTLVKVKFDNENSFWFPSLSRKKASLLTGCISAFRFHQYKKLCLFFYWKPRWLSKWIS